MSEQTSHCPVCRTEFVAGISACSDCGRPLLPGELPPRDRNPAPSQIVGGPEVVVEPPDTLILSIPGEQAELVAKALAVEGIPSLLACDGIEQLRGPHEPPKAPLARRKAVDIYVPESQVDIAREIAESMLDSDLIGDQWRDAEYAPDVSADMDGNDDNEVADAFADHEGGSAIRAPSVPRPEGGRPSLMLFLLVTILVGVFLFLI